MNPIPRVTKCRFCGREIILVPRPEGGWRKLNARLTYYKARPGDTGAPGLWTIRGTLIPGDPLPDELADQADGSAHLGHVCPSWATPKKRRPLTRREKYQNTME